MRSRRVEEPLQLSIPIPPSRLLWLLTGVLITALLLRLAMRALGVREDVPLPGLIYVLTAPFVAPFYSLFPVSDRFDYPALEAASLAAAGVVLAFALGIYMLGLLWQDMKREP